MIGNFCFLFIYFSHVFVKNRTKQSVLLACGYEQIFNTHTQLKPFSHTFHTMMMGRHPIENRTVHLGTDFWFWIKEREPINFHGSSFKVVIPLDKDPTLNENSFTEHKTPCVNKLPSLPKPAKGYS